MCNFCSLLLLLLLKLNYFAIFDDLISAYVDACASVCVCCRAQWGHVIFKGYGPVWRAFRERDTLATALGRWQRVYLSLNGNELGFYAGGHMLMYQYYAVIPLYHYRVVGLSCRFRVLALLGALLAILML